jgi:hypothetical protein
LKNPMKKTSQSDHLANWQAFFSSQRHIDPYEFAAEWKRNAGVHYRPPFGSGTPAEFAAKVAALDEWLAANPPTPMSKRLQQQYLRDWRAAHPGWKKVEASYRRAEAEAQARDEASLAVHVH